jgi:hypothetical protein
VLTAASVLLTSPPILASARYFEVCRESPPSTTWGSTVSLSTFLVSLPDPGFFQTAGFATLAPDRTPFRTSFLMKPGTPSPVSTTCLSNFLRVRGFAVPIRAWVVVGSPRSGRPEEDAQRTP